MRGRKNGKPQQAQGKASAAAAVQKRALERQHPCVLQSFFLCVLLLERRQWKDASPIYEREKKLLESKANGGTGGTSPRKNETETKKLSKEVRPEGENKRGWWWSVLCEGKRSSCRSKELRSVSSGRRKQERRPVAIAEGVFRGGRKAGRAMESNQKTVQISTFSLSLFRKRTRRGLLRGRRRGPKRRQESPRSPGGRTQQRLQRPQQRKRPRPQKTS